jgi:hypothetical protein
MEEKNQQERFLGVDREWGDDPEGQVKVEGASQEYEFSSEESEGEENNREVEHDLPNFGHSLLKCPMAPQWKHPCLSPFLGDGLSDCARYLSIRFLFTSSIMAAI